MNSQIFFAFDYVGAPWLGREYQGSIVYVGNGGFSLRNRTFMLDCIDRAYRHDGLKLEGYEDYFFALCAQKFGRHSNVDIARYFGVESYPPHVEGSFSFHALCRYGLWTPSTFFVNEWLKRCPESQFHFKNGNSC